MQEQTPSIGRKIGKYRVEKKLGSGGMGNVYLAEDTSLKRKVAIKVINLPMTDTAIRKDLLSRFRLEARAAARVSHPNVVTVYDFSEIDGEHLLIMEHLSGRTLRELVDGDKALPPEQVIRHAIAILNGLEAIHKEKMIHRDLKLQNLMLTFKGQLKILDLGCVKFMGINHELTQQGFVMGSPLTMPPEQIKNGKVDIRADIYALGVVLFQLLSGRPPFNGNDPLQIMQQHCLKPVPPLVSPYGPIPQMLNDIVHKAMSKNPKDRYQTALEMRQEIERVPRQRRKSTGPQPSLPQVARVITPVEVRTRSPSASGRLRQTTFRDLPALPRTVTPDATIAIQIKGSIPPPIPAAALRKKRRSKRTLRFVGLAVAITAVAAAFAWVLLSSDLARNAPAAKLPDASIANEAKSLPTETAPVPQAPLAVPTASDGCKAYADGDPRRAIAILKPLASTTSDAETRFCLCAAEHLLHDANEVEDCEAYLQTPNRDKDRDFQVRMWLKKR